MAIEFSEYVDGAAEQAKNTIGRISFSEENLPFGEMRASHHRPFNWQQEFADDAWAGGARAVQRTRGPPVNWRVHHPPSMATRLSRKQREYPRASLMRPVWSADNDVDEVVEQVDCNSAARFVIYDGDGQSSVRCAMRGWSC
jgi:hypothetical protein